MKNGSFSLLNFRQFLLRGGACVSLNEYFSFGKTGLRESKKSLTKEKKIFKSLSCPSTEIIFPCTKLCKHEMT
jgi:hypothetical protein